MLNFKNLPPLPRVPVLVMRCAHCGPKRMPITRTLIPKSSLDVSVLPPALRHVALSQNRFQIWHHQGKFVYCAHFDRSQSKEQGSTPNQL